MTNKATKYGLMTIAAVLLVAMAFAGAASGALSGEGTVSNPYKISSEADLYEMASMVNTGGAAAFANYTLTKSITVTNTSYIPIGYSTTMSFKGTFDGDNNTISGVISNSSVSSNFGIFGVIKNATIKNVILKDLDVTGGPSTKYVGALVGMLDSVDGSGYPTTSEHGLDWYHSQISNVTLKNVSVSSGGSDVGGVVGYVGASSSLLIKNVSADKYCGVIGGSNEVGGIVGYAAYSSVAIVDSKFYGKSVETVGSTGCGVGGMIGRCLGEGSKIQNCKVAGTALYARGHVGGLLGRIDGVNSYVNISGCEVCDCEVAFNAYSSDRGGSCFVGYISQHVLGDYYVKYFDNVIENVTVKPAGVFGAGITGLIEGSYVDYCDSVLQFQISLSSDSDSIAPLKEIVFGNNFTVRNSSVWQFDDTSADGVKKTIDETDYKKVIDKITSVSVGNQVNKIGQNAFNGSSHLQSVTDLSTVTSIRDGAFNNSGLGCSGQTGFYVPMTVTSFGSKVFDNCNSLKVIYGDTTTKALPDSVAKVNITAVGKLTDVNTGSFTPKAGNVFENMTLGGEPVKYFQNLSSDSEAYLFASESWVAGNTYLALASAGTEITLDPVEGSGSAPESVVALPGNKNLSDDIIAPAKAGYTFGGWYNETTGGIIVINTTGNLNVSADGYTNAAGEWTNSSSALTLYANWTVNQTVKVAENNVSIFGNDNYTTVRDPSVISILLESVNNVTGTVTFTADNTSIADSLPTISGMHAPITVSIFDITADNDGSGNNSVFYVNVTFRDIAIKDTVKFFHFNMANNAWDSTPLTSSIVDVYTDENKVLYMVETESFSPFGIGIYSAIPQQYTSSSSHSTGSTQILSEGQVAPTAYATATPTAAPTAEPTPATPTVIATEKPTTQATQQSPAPFLGILAGLGVAALVLNRLRK